MKLFLLDGNSIINRAYFALPVMSGEAGQNVNAVYGFTSILLKILKEYQPTHLVVTFDERQKTFRHQLFPEYKATRKGMPDDLAAQLATLKHLLDVMNIYCVSKSGFEADDVIGTICKLTPGEKYIVSGDKDLFQLIDEDTTVLLTKKGVSEVEKVTPEVLRENYQLTPEQVIEFKALRGDTSDNIPGVKGVGDKTATQLLAEYGNVDNVYANIDQIKGVLRDKLVSDKDMCYLSRALATIKTDSAIDWSIDDAKLCYVFPPELKPEFEKLRFKSMYARLTISPDATVTTITHQVEIVKIASL